MAAPVVELRPPVAGAGVRTFDEVVAPLELECDVVVVGSGAGGAVVATELAEAGRDVVLLEEGGFFRTEDFHRPYHQIMWDAYREFGSTLIYGNPPIAFAEGRALGGTTILNGGLAWRTPERVLAHWVRDHGLAGLAPERLDAYFARVEHRVSARTQDPGTYNNDAFALRRGAERLGWKYVPVQRNQHHCAGTNRCAFGCPSGGKQSTLVSYIPDAVAAGARVYCDAHVARVLLDQGGRRATGLQGRMVRHDDGTVGPSLTVRARETVLAMGAIQTPHFLLQNRLANSSRRVGRHLTVHPNAKAVGVYPEPVQGWKGSHQGWRVDEFFESENMILATAFVPPGLVSFSFGWWGEDSWRRMREYDRMVHAGALVPDFVEGRVRRGPFGRPLMTYFLNRRGIEALLQGAARTAELHFAAGAEKVYLPIRGAEAIRTPNELWRLGAVKRSDLEVLTVHAMGTCRMGTDPRRTVVDPWGETHDVAHLWITDGSTFPGPIHVNPQVTIMALATRSAHRLTDTWDERHDGGR